MSKGLTKITDNVYYYVETKSISPQTSFSVNSGVIIGQNCIVVIDTSTSAKDAQRFIEDIRSISDKPIKYVVTTHYHPDHVLGTSEFAKLGATVIAHASDKKNLEKAGPAMVEFARNIWGMTEEEMEGTAVVYPTLTFNDGMEIDLGDQKIELFYPGASHTGGSILVYLPDKKLLFTGDILSTGYHPYIGEGDIPNWLHVLDNIQNMDVVQIVPGHGPISGKKDVADMREYLVVFDEKATDFCKTSTDLEYIFDELKKVLPQKEGDLMMKRNLMMKYLKK